MKDVRVSLLWQDYEATTAIRYDFAKKIDPSKLDTASKFRHFWFGQLPQAAYKFTLRGSSAAVLTETAAYIVETQARRMQRPKAKSALRGNFGSESKQSVAFRTVRCFDWGRSAVARLDWQRCRAEIKAFKELPTPQQIIQSCSDYAISPWADNLYDRVMIWESRVQDIHQAQTDDDELDSDNYEEVPPEAADGLGVFEVELEDGVMGCQMN